LLAASFKLMLSHNSSYSYAARRADSLKDLRQVEALRRAVFSRGAHEGLTAPLLTQLDAPEFEDVCDHLMVEDMGSGELVATCRLQTGYNAAARRGYSAAREFDLRPFEALRPSLIELGRPCVAPAQGRGPILQLLWRAIALYAQAHGARRLLRSSPVASRDPRVGAALYATLFRTHLAAPAFRTKPLPRFACPLDPLAEELPPTAARLEADLALGARICGPPALDSEVHTIDFLTVLDLHDLPEMALEPRPRNLAVEAGVPSVGGPT
jgi:putative hemolysin